MSAVALSVLQTGQVHCQGNYFLSPRRVSARRARFPIVPFAWVFSSSQVLLMVPSLVMAPALLAAARKAPLCLIAPAIHFFATSHSPLLKDRLLRLGRITV